jgi:hypothetical protein
MTRSGPFFTRLGLYSINAWLLNQHLLRRPNSRRVPSPINKRAKSN